MRRAERLFRLVERLRAGRLVTARQLGREMEVSERTIYRDIAHLIGSGVPIEGEAGMGYVMREGYDLPPLMFDEEEVVALVAGARLIRAWSGPGMAGAAERAIDKIAAVLPAARARRAGSVHIHAFRPAALDPEITTRIERIEDAAERRTRLTFDYDSLREARTRRTVRPLGLYFWGQVWTLVAWCELRGDFRIFRVERIEGIEPGETFRDEPGRTLADFRRLECI